MEIFSEVYGLYYRLMHELLLKAPLTAKEIENHISSHGFGETMIYFAPKIFDGKWPLLVRGDDGRFTTRIKNAPQLPVTNLEKSWLKSLLSDRRISLFLDEHETEELSDWLKNISPLYNKEDFFCFDRSADGDPYDSPAYRENFRMILSAAKKRAVLEIHFKNRRDEERCGHFLPISIEFSDKDDKFRAVCLRIHQDGAESRPHIINIARIISVQNSARTAPPEGTEPDEEPSRVMEAEISDERGGIERFMTEFSVYEKTSWYDEKGKICHAAVKYPLRDEMEILIKILSFGPVLLVKEPPELRQMIAARVAAQTRLMRCDPRHERKNQNV